MSDSPLSATEPYGKKNPFPAPVVNNVFLTEKGSPKEAIQIDFSLEGSGLTYEAGDALAVFPVNDEAVVNEVIAALGLEASSEVSMPDGSTAPLKKALMEAYDVTGLNKSVLTKWAGLSDSAALKSLVEEGDKEKIDDYCWGRGIIDLAVEHPVVFESAAAFVAVLKKLTPRLYSIASSPNAHPGEVQLTVGVVRYTAHGRERGGVCSTYMADRAGKGPARVFVHTNKNFRLPEDTSKPIIMVGPGTGIAPFRAFIEERLVSGATGENWLFFGNPYRASDFLYEEWLLGLEKEGRLRLSLAFSRDQAEKLYVQHLMLQQAADIWALLQQGGCFYVCGDASRMAKDVDHALRKIAETQGGLSYEEAEEFLKQLKKDKRYQRDVY